jgi:hypothetical protein
MLSMSQRIDVSAGRADRLGTSIATCLLLAVAAWWCAAPRAAVAQEPLGSSFTYQGELRGPAGPVDGTYDFEIALWDAAEAGARIGATVVLDNISVLDGRFEVELDFGPGALTTGGRRWLEIAVAPDGAALEPLAPRRPLLAAPQATFATVAGAVEGGVDDADADPDNEKITQFSLSGTSLLIIEAGTPRSVNLLPLLNESGDGHSLDSNNGQIVDVVSVNSSGLVNVGQPVVGSEMKLDVYGSILSQGGATLIANETFDATLSGSPIGQTFRTTTITRLRRVEVLIADPTAGVAMSVEVRRDSFSGQLLGQRTIALDGEPDTWVGVDFVTPLGLTANTTFAIQLREITSGTVVARAANTNPYASGASSAGGASDLAFRAYTERGGYVFPDATIQMSAASPTDELNTSLVLNGTTLELTDAGGTLTVDLAPLQATTPAAAAAALAELAARNEHLLHLNAELSARVEQLERRLERLEDFGPDR